MGDRQPKQPVLEVNLVVHHLKLNCPDLADVQSALTEIATCYPCDKVCFDEQQQTLQIAYDTSKLNEAGILELLLKHHIEVNHDWWTHSRQGYDHLIGRDREEKSKR
ncbi:cation transporter [Porticoccus sp.]